MRLFQGELSRLRVKVLVVPRLGWCTLPGDAYLAHLHTAHGRRGREDGKDEEEGEAGNRGDEWEAIVGRGGREIVWEEWEGGKEAHM